jgi:hypothetical protein
MNHLYFDRRAITIIGHVKAVLKQNKKFWYEITKAGEHVIRVIVTHYYFFRLLKYIK